ncbi:MAG: TauD/TfdA family dioxygenase [Pseudomonadota bacterium]
MQQFAKVISVKKQQDYPSGVFPLVIGPSAQQSLSDTLSHIQEHRTEMLSQLAIHGALLFRGFEVNSPTDFDRVITAFDLENFTYANSLSNAVRVNITERVFTANEAPSSVTIFMHHEMAQTPVFPSKLFFYCEIAPESGGETPICRSDILLERLESVHPDFVSKCDRLGVKYSNTMPNEDDPNSGLGRSWRSTLSADTKEQAEQRLARLNYSWEWISDNTLRATTPVLPIVRELVSGRRVFFNQLIAAFRGWADKRNDPQKSIRFGDDSVIPVEDMQMAIDLADELAFDLAWEAGDVVLIDNFMVMHGRSPFSGSRRVLASLVADDGTQLV